MLPAHVIGLTFAGDIGLGDNTLHYDLGIGNGRGTFADDILAVGEYDDWKSVVARLNFLPGAVYGLEIGVSAYIDRIPPGVTDDGGNVLVPFKQDEQIFGAHIAYTGYPFHFIAEGYQVTHADLKEGDDGVMDSYSLTGGFVEAGYDVTETLRPYGRYDTMSRDEKDGFLTASGAPNKKTEIRLGIRQTLHSKAVFKLEYVNVTENDDDPSHGVTAQVAFGF